MCKKKRSNVICKALVFGGCADGTQSVPSDAGRHDAGEVFDDLPNPSS